jgi:hypothetical protein
MEVCGQLGVPTALPPGKEPLVHQLDRRLSGPQRLSGRGGEEKNSQPLPGPEPPIIQPVAQYYTTELSWKINTMVAEPEGCTPLTRKPATGHDPEPVPSTPYVHRLFPYDMSF